MSDRNGTGNETGHPLRSDPLSPDTGAELSAPCRNRTYNLAAPSDGLAARNQHCGRDPLLNPSTETRTAPEARTVDRNETGNRASWIGSDAATSENDGVVDAPDLAKPVDEPHARDLRDAAPESFGSRGATGAGVTEDGTLSRPALVRRFHSTRDRLNAASGALYDAAEQARFDGASCIAVERMLGFVERAIWKLDDARSALIPTRNDLQSALAAVQTAGEVTS
ncbi:MAG: hypothetical protein HOQ11_10205 [Gemmatimonadaceae bacterium]|nr:hypothetical protein [Gemmatimonadaceae bacterium]NUR19533.1 hypothetical protein [Gemmatimonadaceae bacterium]NUS97763.1 hypothetical protein [Gemmatimonadaceae bacterium]